MTIKGIELQKQERVVFEIRLKMEGSWESYDLLWMIFISTQFIHTIMEYLEKGLFFIFIISFLTEIFLF